LRSSSRTHCRRSANARSCSLCKTSDSSPSLRSVMSLLITNTRAPGRACPIAMPIGSTPQFACRPERSLRGLLPVSYAQKFVFYVSQRLRKNRYGAVCARSCRRPGFWSIPTSPLPRGSKNGTVPSMSITKTES